MTENSTPNAAPSAAVPPEADDASEHTTYAAAIAEVEEILSSLEGSAVDVDHLAEQVTRAGFLLQICRERLTKVKGDVSTLVDGITNDPHAVTAPAAMDDPDA